MKIKKERLRPKNSEVNKLVCDNLKILSRTKWKPKINLNKGLKKTIEWFKNINDLSKSDKYNI